MSLLEVADTLANLGGLGLEWLRHDGKYDTVMWEAESQLAEALEIRSTVLGHQHPLSLQVKSLHDMIRTNSSLMPDEIGPFYPSHMSDKSSRLTNHTDMLSREAGSSASSRRAPTSPSTLSFGSPFRSRSAHTSQPSATSVSPGRTAKISKDAPAPKADSSSPLLELISQTIAARKSTTKALSSQPTRSLSRGARVGSRPVVSPRSVDAVSTSSDHAPTDEDDSLLNDPPRRRRSRAQEKTKIYIEPHYIPRQSPTRKSSSPEGSFFSDTTGRTPAVTSSSWSDSSQGPQSSIHAYDAEESCLINGSGDRVDLLSSFLVRGGEDDEDGVNLSSHEIMVVRPTASAVSRDGHLVLPLSQTMNGRWTGEAKRKPLSPPSSGADKELEENDDGIAPLSRHHISKIDHKVRLSKGMLENPERHLSDIHTVASRYLKVSSQMHA